MCLCVGDTVFGCINKQICRLNKLNLLRDANSCLLELALSFTPTIDVVCDITWFEFVQEA